MELYRKFFDIMFIGSKKGSMCHKKYIGLCTTNQKRKIVTIFVKY